jgi:hypothetical protein
MCSRRPPRALSARLSGVQLVPEVPQGVGLAVGLRGEGGAHRGAQVGPVQPDLVKLGRKPRDLRGERGRVGECVGQRLPPVRQRRQDRREAGDDIPRVRVPSADLVKVDFGVRVGVSERAGSSMN